jgi:sugar lactone lactonase YvrE
MWIGFPQYVAADDAGNVYFTSIYATSFNCVFKMDPNGVVTRVAGTSRPGFSGDGGPATSAQVNRPVGLVVDTAGDLFIADTGNDRIRKVSPDGIITTVAGNGTHGFSGDGGPAITAQLGASPFGYDWAPTYLAVDSGGNLFMADYGRIRRVSPDGIISTVVEKISGPLTVDASGNLYIANTNFIDPGHTNIVIKLAPDGTMSTVAGGGAVSGNTLGWTGVTSSACLDNLSGDGGSATQTGLCRLTSLAVDAAGNLFVGEEFYDDPAADNGAWALRKVSPDGTISTAAGNTHDWAQDGNLATSGMIAFGGSTAVDGAGNLFITDNESIRKIALDGIINSVAGRAGGNDLVWQANQHFGGDGGPATNAMLFRPYSLAVDWNGNLFIADENRRVRKVTPGGIITTVAGGGGLVGVSADGGPATSAALSLTSFSSFSNEVLAVDGIGNLFILETDHVRRVSPDGIIITVAGGGTIEGPAADGGPATNAKLSLSVMGGIAADIAGNLYIAESGAQRVRKVTPDGIISTLAGTGTQGPSGDGGLATRAQLAYPFIVAADNAGDVFIADGYGERIRMVAPNGIVTTVAGNGKPGYSGDGGPAIAAALSMNGIAADAMGNLFIATAGPATIRQITPDGVISTVAGSNAQGYVGHGYSGDGGPATQGTLADTMSAAVDRAGNVYIADTSNNAVRVLRPAIGPPN